MAQICGMKYLVMGKRWIHVGEALLHLRQYLG